MADYLTSRQGVVKVCAVIFPCDICLQNSQALDQILHIVEQLSTKRLKLSHSEPINGVGKYPWNHGQVPSARRSLAETIFKEENMGLRINTNTASLNSQRVLWGTKINLDKSMEKLSSGFRINRAGDDAAGLAISENLKAQVRGLKQAARNAQDGISLVQVAEGAMNEVSSILIRLRELSVQAASDTIGPVERQFLNVEYDQMVSEIDRISEGTEFNGTQLLAGVGSILDFQVGTRNNPEIDRISFDASKADANSAALGVNLTSVADKAWRRTRWPPLTRPL